MHIQQRKEFLDSGLQQWPVAPRGLKNESRNSSSEQAEDWLRIQCMQRYFALFPLPQRSRVMFKAGRSQSKMIFFVCMSELGASSGRALCFRILVV